MASGVDIRISGPTGIEDHHAHFLRLDFLDRCLHFGSGDDDHAIDTHCLRLLAANAVLIGSYVDGVMRAGVQIIPDRNARRAQAFVTIESEYQSDALVQELIGRAREEARKCRFAELVVQGADEAPLQPSAQIARFA